MSSMLVRHPMETKPPAPRAGGFGLSSLFRSSWARQHPGLFAEKENERVIEVRRRVVPVVKGTKISISPVNWGNVGPT